MSEVSERLAEALAEMPEARNVFDMTDEATTMIEAPVEDVADALAPVVEQMLAEARAEERERAKFNDDVRREQVRAARAEALREAADVAAGTDWLTNRAKFARWLRDRADAAEREAR